MPAAIPEGIRRQIIEAKSQGKPLVEIAREKKLSYSTVRNIWRLHRDGKPLAPKYHNCGPKTNKHPALIYRASVWLKRLHSEWGAGLIGLKLQERYGDERIPHPRTMQRWFKAAGLNRVRNKIPQGERKWASQVHETWQLDAKEQFKLVDGQPACYLTVIDEKSGGLLAAKAFPPVPNK